jgi:hypothetical protein
MNPADTGTLFDIITQVGLGGIFLYLFIKVRNEYREDIAKKDDVIKEQSNKLIQVIEKNTEVITNNTATVQANTKATDKLTTSVDAILRSQQ